MTKYCCSLLSGLTVHTEQIFQYLRLELLKAWAHIFHVGEEENKSTHAIKQQDQGLTKIPVTFRQLLLQLCLLHAA